METNKQEGEKEKGGERVENDDGPQSEGAGTGAGGEGRRWKGEGMQKHRAINGEAGRWMDANLTALRRHRCHAGK